MKRMLSIVFLAAACASFDAPRSAPHSRIRWWPVLNNPVLSVTVDLDSLKEGSDGIDTVEMDAPRFLTAWFRFKHAEPQNEPKGGTYNQTMAKADVDCQQRRYRFVKIVLQQDGKTVSKVEGEQPWEEIVPDSGNDSVWGEFCRKIEELSKDE